MCFRDETQEPNHVGSSCQSPSWLLRYNPMFQNETCLIHPSWVYLPEPMKKLRSVTKAKTPQLGSIGGALGPLGTVGMGPFLHILGSCADGDAYPEAARLIRFNLLPTFNLHTHNVDYLHSCLPVCLQIRVGVCQLENCYVCTCVHDSI